MVVSSHLVSLTVGEHGAGVVRPALVELSKIFLPEEICVKCDFVLGPNSTQDYKSCLFSEVNAAAVPGLRGEMPGCT